MFGLGNNYVINQRQAPAIWESPAANQPTNFIEGRILIDPSTGYIYLDSQSDRQIISRGDVQPYNGLAGYGGIGAIERIGLGGSLDFDTQTDLNGHTFSFLGTTTNVDFLPNGAMLTNVGFIPSASTQTGLIVPTITLVLTNINTGDRYGINCVINP